MRAQQWSDCDADIKAFVYRLIDQMSAAFGEELKGIYLHGSLATGSYYRPKSDLDLIVVVENPLPPSLYRQTNQRIAQLAQTRPTQGNLECSVITAETAFYLPIPMPYELHYSSHWHDRILAGQVDYEAERFDPDLPAHLYCVGRRGVCLWGEPVKAVFGPVRWEDFFRAVWEDYRWILQDETILQNPCYGILNICRTMQLLEEKSAFPSNKDEGGAWGFAHFPYRYRPLIQTALTVYHSEKPADHSAFPQAELLAFRDYARKRTAGFLTP